KVVIHPRRIGGDADLDRKRRWRDDLRPDPPLAGATHYSCHDGIVGIRQRIGEEHRIESRRMPRDPYNIVGGTDHSTPRRSASNRLRVRWMEMLPSRGGKRVNS